MRETIDRKGMSVLSSGHLATDFASGAVPALLPFFTVKFDLSYTLTAVLILAALISSSVVQPLFGLWSDRRGALWLLPAGLALAGGGLGLAAVAPSYPVLARARVHRRASGSPPSIPKGAKFAVFLSGKKRASGMSLFNIGGNLGYALGPIIVTPLVLWLGLGPGGLLASVPVLIASVAVLGALPYLARQRPQHDGGRRDAGAKDDVRAMVILAGVIGLRSVAWFTLIAFVPLWAVSQGDTEAEGNRLLSLMLLAGAVGTLLLGPIADRFGIRRTLLVAQALLTPLILVFVLAGRDRRRRRAGRRRHLRRRHVRSHDGAGPDVPAAACRPRLGLSVGLAMGLGGIAAVALGAVADAVDLEDRPDLQRARAAARRRALLPPACPEAADLGCDGAARAIPSARLTPGQGAPT